MTLLKLLAILAIAGLIMYVDLARHTRNHKR